VQEISPGAVSLWRATHRISTPVLTTQRPAFVIHDPSPGLWSFFSQRSRGLMVQLRIPIELFRTVRPPRWCVHLHRRLHEGDSENGAITHHAVHAILYNIYNNVRLISRHYVMPACIFDTIVRHMWCRNTGTAAIWRTHCDSIAVTGSVPMWC
jgi:hypothetical protein